MKKIIFIFLAASISIAQSSLPAENYNYNKSNASILLTEKINNLQKENVSSTALSHVVFGYLPWWEYAAGYHQYIRYDLLTHIAVASFEADRDGNLTNPPGWPWYDVLENAHSNGVKVIMTVTSLDSLDIHRLMTDIGVRNKLFENIRLAILFNNLDGVNIDFENFRDENDKKFAAVTFMMHLREYFRFNPLYELSFATPSFGFDQWNFQGLAEYCNYLFVMNYDYWGSWANLTGPSAPLTGPFMNVTNSIVEEYKNVPPSKIILGVPYYGNYWKTNSNHPYSAVKPFNQDSANNDWQAIVRYREVMENYSTHSILWDTVSNTPWILWNDDGWNQIWYDDSTSLELKYDLAINQNLLGIGIWALGYDGDRQELWKLIEKKFANPSSFKSDDKLPADIVLYQNYPNPFNPGTTIKYSIPLLESAGTLTLQKVVLKIFDLLGKEVVTLIDDYKLPGEYSVAFTPNESLPSGIYFYQLVIGSNLLSKKMIFLK